MRKQQIKEMKNAIEENIKNGNLKSRIDILYYIQSYSENKIDLRTALQLSSLYEQYSNIYNEEN